VKISHIFAAAAVAMVVGFAGSPAAAAVFSNADLAIYQEQNTFPDTSDEKVYSNKTEKDGSLTVTGNVGSQDGVPHVLFTMDTLVEAANGFSQIGKGSGLFYSLTFEIPGETFPGLKFSTQGDQSNSDVKISAFLQGVELGSYSTSGLGDSDQKWLVLGLFGQLFDKIVVTSTTGFKSLKHFEVSELTAVPLPAAVYLFGTALAGLGVGAYRRRRQTRTD
jgi:hypothetical protein